MAKSEVQHSVSLFKSKSRELSDGTLEFLVTVRSYFNKKNQYKSTSVYCKEADWDKKKFRVLPSDPDWREKNAQINEVFANVISPREEGKKKRSLVPTNLLEALSELMTLPQKPTTVRNKKGVYNYLNGKVPPELLRLDRFNQSRYNQIRDQLVKEKQSSSRGGGINNILKIILQTYRYAFECGYLRTYKPIKLNPVPIIPKKPEERLEYRDYQKLVWEFNEKHIFRGGYNTNKPSAFDLFILMLVFQGMPPVDIALLKVKDVVLCEDEPLDFDPYTPIEGRKKEIQTISLYRLSYRRWKTGEYVEVSAPVEIVGDIIRAYTKDKEPDDYLIPCFTRAKIEQREKKGEDVLRLYIRDRINSYFNNTMEKYLNTRYIPKGDNYCHKKLTYYEARRAFVTLVEESEGLSQATVKRMIGHKLTGSVNNYYRKDVSAQHASHILGIFKKLDFHTLRETDEIQYIKKRCYQKGGFPV